MLMSADAYTVQAMTKVLSSAIASSISFKESGSRVYQTRPAALNFFSASRLDVCPETKSPLDPIERRGSPILSLRPLDSRSSPARISLESAAVSRAESSSSPSAEKSSADST